MLQIVDDSFVPPPNKETVCYAVRWIEIDFGRRDEGYRIFFDVDICKEQTRKSSEKGSYGDGGGYCGPERPLSYYEIPLSCLTDNDKIALQENGFVHTRNSWQPKFKSQPHRVV